MQSVQEEFSTWFARADQTAFAHAKLPLESPIDRVQHIAEGTGKVTSGGGLVVFLVADALEKKLLVDEIKQKKPGFALKTTTNLLIEDYATFYASLRRKGGWPGWKEKQVTVICNVDLHYSAAFALCMIFFILWARRPLSSTTLRLLTLSDTDQVEPSLSLCMAHLLPSTQNFTCVTLSTTGKGNLGILLHKPWLENEDFVDAVFRHVSFNAHCSHSSVVVCSLRQHNQLHDKIEATLGKQATFNYISNLDCHAEDIVMSCRSPSASVRPAATGFGIITTGHLPVQLERVSGILIGNESYRSSWETGRLVHEYGQRSRREVQQAFLYAHQSAIPEITIRHPILESLLHNPPLKLENGEIWGFVASLVIALQGNHVEVEAIASFFLGNQARYDTTLQQLDVMGFLKHRRVDGGHFQMYFPQKKAVDCVEELLPILNYDFAAAWFLALGLGDDKATGTAQRAMAYIAAISATETVAQGIPAVFYKEDMCKVLSNTLDKLMSGQPRELPSELSFQLYDWVSFPPHLWLQGGIWTQMALFHSLYSVEPTMSVLDSMLDELVLTTDEAIRTLRQPMK